MATARAGQQPGSAIARRTNDSVADLDEQFPVIQRLMYELSGVSLSEQKRELVRSRLAKHLRTGPWGSVKEYLAFARSPQAKGELTTLVDLLTTNKTSFFREEAHFEVFSAQLAKLAPIQRRIRIWSAGCSSGEEPYTLAMIVRETLGEARSYDIKILATDINSTEIMRASEGVYDIDRVGSVSESLRRKYFHRHVGGTTKGRERLEVDAALRELVSYGRLNLMAAWPMNGPFDTIFCRNVMIYFDQPTRERLVNRLWSLLAPGGLLFVGHSESLSALEHPFHYLQPAVYSR